MSRQSSGAAGRFVAQCLGVFRTSARSASDISKICFASLITVGLILIFLLVNALRFSFFQSYQLFELLRDVSRQQVRGNPYEAHELLGYCGRPGARGSKLLAAGVEIPLCYDERGFRVPLGHGEEARPLQDRYLFLGCSYMHGDGVPAEWTFPARVSRARGARCLNGALSGYGLGHMVMLSRMWIPSERPRVVFMQYSRWLVERSSYIFSSTVNFPGRVPIPYFARNSSEEIVLESPVYQAVRFDYDLTLPIASPSFLGFSFETGLPLFLRDDLRHAGLQVRAALGRVQPPVSRSDWPEVVQAAYREVADICDRGGSRLVLIYLDQNQRVDRTTRDSCWELAEELSCLFVDGQEALVGDQVFRSQEEFVAKFGVWGGSPRRLLDAHFNSAGHKRITDAILRVL